MTSEEYYAMMKALGLRKQPGALSVEADMFLDREGELHRIPKADLMTQQERSDFVELLKIRIGHNCH